MFNIKNPFVKYLLAFLLCAVAATTIRLYPLQAHIWSDSNEQASMAVIFNIKRKLLEQMHQQYPQMSLEEADRIASVKLNETLRLEKRKVREAIEKVNDSIHKQSGSKDQVYLLEADPFYFYYLTENIITEGHMAKTIKGNKYFNPLMGAPNGFWQPLSLHPYVGVFVYNVARIFNPDISLMTAVAYVPLVLTLLALAAFCWCGFLFGLSVSGVLAGCFALAMAPIFLKRSSLGWYDTDPYNILFPILFLCVFLKSFTSKKPAIWGAALGLILLGYSLIWQGWVFLFFMTLISSAAICFYSFAVTKNKPAAIGQLFLAGAYLCVTVILGSIVYGFNDFLSFFSEGAGELAKFTVKGMSLWPNLFLEVGELKKSSAADLIANTGGIIFLGCSLAGLTLALRNLSLKSILAAIFLIITLVLSFKAERFTIFTLIPLALFFGVAIAWAVDQLSRFPKPSILQSILLAAVVCFFFVNAQKNIRTVLTPIYNGTWNQSMLALKTKTPIDSIINTWWPPGHFIKGAARRSVPFDGASLSESITGYWMATILLSTNEDQARGLLRMLNSSGNKAILFLTSKGMKTSQGVDLLKQIASQSREQAKATLSATLKPEDANHLLELTHGRNPHSYILVYNEIVDENVGLAFVAKRDFKKIEQLNNNANLLASIPKADSPDFINFLWQLSGGSAPKYSEPLNLVGKTADAMMFRDGLIIKNDMSVTIDSKTYGRGTPKSIVFKSGDAVTERLLPNANLNYSVVLYEQDGTPSCRLMDQDLANSLMMRMFFFDGVGLKNFELIDSQSDLTGRTKIKIFKAN
jgi:dolichyl-phosphooligosaccharide-protein glycotransferase